MTVRTFIRTAASIIILMSVITTYYYESSSAKNKRNIQQPSVAERVKMTASTSIISAIDAFVTAQNAGRSGVTPLDYDALTGSVPTNGNSVIGISGITSGGGTIALPTSGIGNSIIVDGGISTSASTTGPDSYSLGVATDGTLTLTDNNTGFSQVITGAHEVVFNLAATTSTGEYTSSYIVATGNAAIVASMYGAALEREPDFSGLDFYLSRLGTSIEPDLHMAATYILGSPEELNLYPAAKTTPDHGGGNDQSFVLSLYSGILHRTPTSAELAFYDQVLAGTYVNSGGQTLAAVDRATVLEYFAASPENQANIAATKGGWLVNPVGGPVYLGAISQTQANEILAREISSGAINLSDFAGMSSSTFSASSVGATTSNGNVTISGANSIAGSPQINITNVPNLTITLSNQYYIGIIGAPNTTVNSDISGGNIVAISNSPTVVNGLGQTVPGYAGSGTINLFGNSNWIAIDGLTTTPALTLVNGWNVTDIMVGNGSTGSTNQNVLLFQGNASSPVDGNTLGAQNSGTWFTSHGVAINVGQLADDSIATMVTLANKMYTVADIGTPNAPNSEEVLFFGQDSKGNTIVDFWHGDTTKTHIISAADITGWVELVGVQASSLTSANFHH